MQRWIYDQGWTELRDAQEKAIAPILDGVQDVIIAAATATGKTEAAFLPICSRLLSNGCAGATVLYISPLKALINDQNERMERLCEKLGIEVRAWHGDISQTRKQAFLKAPSGILLITPESLEGIFVNRGSSVPSLFSGLQYVVVDELHSFMGAERGKQLQSLLNRLEYSTKRRVPRIALSATLGDIRIAAEFLRPGEGLRVLPVVSNGGGQTLQLLVKGYKIAGMRGPADPNSGEEQEQNDGSRRAVAEDLFRVLRGSKNLAFANGRREVEKYTDLLTQLSETERRPNEFFAHHGNLSRELRQHVEAALKDETAPCTAVCTSTLELGIDIGSVKSIVQIGTPNSVATLRQRFGRSGRRGNPGVLRVYIREPEIDSRSTIEDSLRFELVQTIAMVNLLHARWCEPPVAGRLHLSTLCQQILSLIAQYGGIRAKHAWSILCGSFGIDHKMFIAVLRVLGDKELIRQEQDGTLLLDEPGERIVNHYSFFAAFATPEEYRIVSGSKGLGTLPSIRPIEAGSGMIFAGRRWRVVRVDERRRVIEVSPATGGRAPTFFGEVGDVHDRVRQEMRAVYVADVVPAYLDATALDLLSEARRYFTKYGLNSRSIVPVGAETVILTWMGNRVNDTICLFLKRNGCSADAVGPCVRVSASHKETLTALERITSEPPPDPLILAAQVRNKRSEKYHGLLDESLLNADFASKQLNTIVAHAVVQQLIRGSKTAPDLKLCHPAHIRMMTRK